MRARVEFNHTNVQNFLHRVTIEGVQIARLRNAICRHLRQLAELDGFQLMYKVLTAFCSDCMAYHIKLEFEGCLTTRAYEFGAIIFND